LQQFIEAVDFCHRHNIAHRYVAVLGSIAADGVHKLNQALRQSERFNVGACHGAGFILQGSQARQHSSRCPEATVLEDLRLWLCSTRVNRPGAQQVAPRVKAFSAETFPGRCALLLTSFAQNDNHIQWTPQDDVKRQDVQELASPGGACAAYESMVCLLCRTPEYMSPELLHNQSKEKGQLSEYDARLVDVWASGVLLLVSLCGAFPFDHTRHQRFADEEELDLW
jgi:serine/threonine protein kinase